MDQQLTCCTWTWCLYILEIHSFHPPWGVPSIFINISISICETLTFRTLLFLFCFWVGALFNLGLLTLEERQLTQASLMRKTCLPNILTQHNPDVVVAKVCSVFLMTMYAETRYTIGLIGVPSWLSWWTVRLQCRKPGFNPSLGEIPWRKEQLPIPVFWPGEFHGLYLPRGHEELDMTEWLLLCFTSLLRPDCASWEDQYDIAYVCVSSSQGQLPNKLGVIS